MSDLERLQAIRETVAPDLPLVWVLRDKVEPPPRPVLTNGADPTGWALWPSTLIAGEVRAGTDDVPDGPPLEAEWVLDDDATLRIVTTPTGPMATEIREHGSQVSRAVPALRETVLLRCAMPAGTRAALHVFWTIDPVTDAPVRGFDRFAGYVSPKPEDTN